MLDHLARLEDEVAAMTDAVAAADPEAAVPACPGWTTRSLVSHLVGVHLWATAALSSDGPPPYAEPALDDLSTGYAAAASALLTALRRVPPDAPVWTFARHDRTAGFWRRRQLHEVAVHRWDLAPYALDDEVAFDGVEEVLEVLAPRQIAMGRIPQPGGGLRLVAPVHTWQMGTEPFTVLEGSAGELLLRLWGRGKPMPEGWTGLTP